VWMNEAAQRLVLSWPLQRALSAPSHDVLLEAGACACSCRPSSCLLASLSSRSLPASKAHPASLPTSGEAKECCARNTEGHPTFDAVCIAPQAARSGGAGRRCCGLPGASSPVFPPAAASAAVCAGGLCCGPDSCIVEDFSADCDPCVGEDFCSRCGPCACEDFCSRCGPCVGEDFCSGIGAQSSHGPRDPFPPDSFPMRYSLV